MRKAWVAALGLVLVCVLAFTWRTAAAAGAAGDEVKLASLVNDMTALNPSGLQAMRPIPIRQWEIPGPGVDVMRARVEETYSVDGIGQDTVELTGWVAVKHGQAYTVNGAKEINWNTAILPTEFVGLELNGTSAVFGPVHISLDKARPSYGEVGRIEIPELAKHNLLARLEKNDAAAENARVLAATGEGAPAATAEPKPSKKPDKPAAAPPPSPPTEVDPSTAGACKAAANVRIDMPKLGLQMTTQKPVLWYSLVDTIPPVGHNASIAVEPVRLISGEREVATLSSGIVKFREVVRQVKLSSGAVDQLASKH